jgi:hypothetical protein
VTHLANVVTGMLKSLNVLDELPELGELVIREIKPPHVHCDRDRPSLPQSNDASLNPCRLAWRGWLMRAFGASLTVWCSWRSPGGRSFGGRFARRLATSTAAATPLRLRHDLGVRHETYEQLDHAGKLSCRLKPPESVLDIQRGRRGGIKDFKDRRVCLPEQCRKTRLEIVFWNLAQRVKLGSHTTLFVVEAQEGKRVQRAWRESLGDPDLLQPLQVHGLQANLPVLFDHCLYGTCGRVRRAPVLRISHDDYLAF